MALIRVVVVCLGLLAWLGLPWAARGQGPAPAGVLAEFNRDWGDDPVWHDGKAEIAVYDAARVIYGQPRAYRAVLMTNKELADPNTFTKSSTAQGREVFKHHLREDVPTENYTYHFSTMCYVGVSDLKSLKIDMGSQEFCGATFKQVVNHAGTLQWRQFSYFPDEGMRTGNYAPPADLIFHDALTLVLRGYPFARPRDLAVSVLPDQTGNRLTSADPVAGLIQHAGRETVETPLGPIECHRLRVRLPGTERKREEATWEYWFAADAGPSRLRVLVKMQGPDGSSLLLRSLERRAYWRS